MPDSNNQQVQRPENQTHHPLPSKNNALSNSQTSRKNHWLQKSPDQTDLD